jgi:hypothetical protein
MMAAMSKPFRSSLPFFLCATLAAVACGDSGASGGNGGTSSNGGAPTTNGGGGQAGGFITGTGGASGGGEPCAQDSSEATLINQPVDIIFVIDNSGSMSAEIEEVEQQINANFAAIIDSATPAIDYRVIMVAAFGDSGNQQICVAEPLGGIPDNDGDGHCDNIPNQPVNTAKFFHHSVDISSHDALCQLIDQLAAPDQFDLQPAGYAALLRPEAFKFFAVITDDNVSCDNYDDGNSVAEGEGVATAWDTNLRTAYPAEFGALDGPRKYSFWSIVALEPLGPSAADPYGAPHAPSDPITTNECTPSAVNPGTGYQALSVLTEGYRFPTCGLDYTDIFTLMAQGVIQGAAVPCEYDVPAAPDGQTIDLATVQVQYASAGLAVSTFNQVADLASCAADSFYIEAAKIKLCPDACALVQADPDASVNILYGCDIDVR